MKLNYKVFKALVEEPFLTQEINGNEVGFYYMNETPFLQQFVMRGRFYVWTSDGKSYKLLIERGYYERVSYFFEQEINAVWLNFLEEVTSVNSKMSRNYLMISMGASLAIIILFSILLPSQLTWGIIAALVLTLVGNMIHSNKVNKIVREMNLNAQEEIRKILSEEKFNQFLTDQEEYMKEYFAFDEDEEEFDEELDMLETNDLDEEAEEIEEDEVLEEDESRDDQ